MSPRDHSERGMLSNWPLSAVHIGRPWRDSRPPGSPAELGGVGGGAVHPCAEPEAAGKVRGGDLWGRRCLPLRAGPGLPGPVRMHFSKCRCELDPAATPELLVNTECTVMESWAAIRGRGGASTGRASTAGVARRRGRAGDRAGRPAAPGQVGAPPRSHSGQAGPDLSALQGSYHYPPTRRGTGARRAASPAPKGQNPWSRGPTPGPRAVGPLPVSMGHCPLPGGSLASQVLGAWKPPTGQAWEVQRRLHLLRTRADPGVILECSKPQCCFRVQGSALWGVGASASRGRGQRFGVQGPALRGAGASAQSHCARTCTAGLSGHPDSSFYRIKICGALARIKNILSPCKSFPKKLKF